LPIGIQAALEDLQYNTGGTFLGPALFSALYEGQSTGDYTAAIYEIAFNTAAESPVTSGDIAYSKRTFANAATMLGMDVTLDGDHYVSSLSSSGADQTPIIDFMKMMALNPPNSGYLLSTNLEYYF
jgi:hypothetical protein